MKRKLAGLTAIVLCLSSVSAAEKLTFDSVSADPVATEKPVDEQPEAELTETPDNDPPEISPVAGDINEDGSFNTADLLMFRKWFLDESDLEIPNLNAADFCEDGVLNIADFCKMKSELIRIEKFDDTPLLLLKKSIKRYYDGVDIFSDAIHYQNNIVTSDGNMYDTGYQLVKPDGTPEQLASECIENCKYKEYISDEEKLQKIRKFAENAEQYKDCTMQQSNIFVDSISQIDYYVYYKDENGDMQSLLFYRCGKVTSCLDNDDVREFTKMLIDYNYIYGSAFWTEPARQYITIDEIAELVNNIDNLTSEDFDKYIRINYDNSICYLTKDARFLLYIGYDKKGKVDSLYLSEVNGSGQSLKNTDDLNDFISKYSSDTEIVEPDIAHFPADFWMIVGDNTNLYAGPGMEYEIIGNAQDDGYGIINSVGYNLYNDDWIYVKTRDKYGWLKTRCNNSDDSNIEITYMPWD